MSIIATDVPEIDEPEPALQDEAPGTKSALSDPDSIPGPPQPVNWNLLTADEAGAECLELDRWVNWLRHTYGLSANVIPPFWHRHPELMWELSALHLHWLCAYAPDQNGSAPIGWHRDFVDAKQRLRDWVAASVTRLGCDRPTRQTVWPGETPAPPVDDIVILDRAADFDAFVAADIARRQAAEDAFYASLDDEHPDSA